MEPLTQEIKRRLRELADEKYRDFSAKLTPTSYPILGVRTPELRAFASELGRREDITLFLCDVPHEYHEENSLHAFIAAGMRGYAGCMEETERFLPHIDNWAVCDQFSPRVFRKHRAELFEKIKLWLRSEETFTVRFGLGMLMAHFLDEDFSPEVLELAASVRAEEYYISMMQAWFFATALAKQRDETLPYFEQRRLGEKTLLRAIQKSRDSRRISPEDKQRLAALRRGRKKNDT